MSVTALDLRAVTAGPGRLGQATPITSPEATEDLAHWLLSPHRDWTVVVISSITVGEPPLDPAQAARLLEMQAEVYVVPNGSLTWRLLELLPDGTAVYGNAVRVYPTGAGWRNDPRRTPLLAGNRVRTETLVRRVSQATRSGSSRSAYTGAVPTIGAYPMDTGPTRIDTVEDARDLADHLLDPARRHPVAVVSVHPAADSPYLNASLIAEELRGLAAVVVVGADATYGLTDTLGDKQLSVFYGAGRVYPVGQTWVDDMHLAPLRMCTNKRESPRATQAVIEAGLTAAHHADLLQPPPAAPTDMTVTASVDSINAHHFVVRSNGTQAVARTAALAIGIPGDRLLHSHQQLTGRIRGTGRLIAEFLPDRIPDDPAARVRAAYPAGTTALARVATVDAEQATVLLHPDVRASLIATGDTRDLDTILSVDDTVAVTVTWSETGCTATLADVDDTEAIAAGVSVLPGGPAWLVPADLEPEPELDEEPPPAAEPTPPLTPAGTSTSPVELLQQLAVARDAAEQFAADADRARREAAHLTSQEKRLRSELRKAHATIRGLKARNQQPPVFTDPEQQLRHEVSLTYLGHVAEPDRSAWPLPDNYVTGPDFIRSLEALEGIDRSKVLQVVVDVLTGRAAQMPARGVRHWKESQGGKRQVRADGAKAYRVNLQNNTPGARRMKYWQQADGRIELDFIGLHDDGLD